MFNIIQIILSTLDEIKRKTGNFRSEIDGTFNICNRRLMWESILKQRANINFVFLIKLYVRGVLFSIYV